MKTCFVIAPIGEIDSDIRKRSDQIFRHVITPAIAPLGYEPLRADQISEPGIITSQIIQHIVEDPLVIADLTDRNPNVFYELALRHALRKPLVQMIRIGEPIPFDVAASRTIQVDHKDLDSVEAAKIEIYRQIQAVEADPMLVDSPISVALQLQLYRESDNPEKRALAELVNAITDLRQEFRLFINAQGSLKRFRPQNQIVPYALSDEETRKKVLLRNVEILRVEEQELMVRLAKADGNESEIAMLNARLLGIAMEIEDLNKELESLHR